MRRKVVKKRHYTVINDYDPNDSFEVEASSYEEAMTLALEDLGWWVAEPHDETDCPALPEEEG